MSIYNPTGAEPVPSASSLFCVTSVCEQYPDCDPSLDSALIYVAQNGTYLPGFNENSTIPFAAGKTYRLRIINTSAFAMFYVWLDGHQMSVIEADGVRFFLASVYCAVLFARHRD